MANVFPYERKPEDVARPGPVTLDADTFVSVLEVAIGNECRTHRQQAALVKAARPLRNVFCDWEAWVQESWTSSPCERCGKPVEIGQNICRPYCVDRYDDHPEPERIDSRHCRCGTKLRVRVNWNSGYAGASGTCPACMRTYLVPVVNEKPL